MGIQIKVNYEKAVKDFDDLKKHIMRNAEFGADKALDAAVDQLKASLKALLNNDVKTFTSEDLKDTEAATYSPNINVPKSKADIIKHIFGEDLKNADAFKKSSKGNTFNDNSNVFVLDNGRIKAWQSIGDSSTLDSEDSRFKNRLVNGIIIDSKTGKIYKPNPKDIKGTKLECSTDTGNTLNSNKKFDAYKQSDKMSRQKDGDPKQRLAVWTMRQEDVRNMMSGAISIDDIVERILEGDFDTAKGLLQKINEGSNLEANIRKIDDIKNNKNLAPDTAAFLATNNLINNLKIEKKPLKTYTKYTLFSNYDSKVDENVKFMASLRQEITIWQVSNEQIWFKAIVDQVYRALEQFDSKAKFK